MPDKKQTAQARILMAEIDRIFAQPSKRTLKLGEALDVLAKLDGRKNNHVVATGSEATQDQGVIPSTETQAVQTDWPFANGPAGRRMQVNAMLRSQPVTDGNEALRREAFAAITRPTSSTPPASELSADDERALRDLLSRSEIAINDKDFRKLIISVDDDLLLVQTDHDEGGPERFNVVRIEDHRDPTAEDDIERCFEAESVPSARRHWLEAMTSSNANDPVTCLVARGGVATMSGYYQGLDAIRHLILIARARGIIA